MTPRLKPQRRWGFVHEVTGRLEFVWKGEGSRAAAEFENAYCNARSHAYPGPCRVVRVEVRDARPCVWRYDEDTDAWDSECGEKWQFMVGGPKENHVRCCQGCGARVKVARS